MLQKEPPAVTKAQRPVQRVMMKMGPRLASYQGFRNVWGGGDRENHVRKPPTPPREEPWWGAKGHLGAEPLVQLTSPEVRR